MTHFYFLPCRSRSPMQSIWLLTKHTEREKIYIIIQRADRSLLRRQLGNYFELAVCTNVNDTFLTRFGGDLMYRLAL